MKTYCFAAQVRTQTGSLAARRLLRQRLVPAALYAKAFQKMLAIPYTTAEKIIYTPEVFLFEIDVEGEIFPALLREVQFHPIHDTIQHLDFWKVHPDQEVTVWLPIHLVGKAEGVQIGGKLIPKQRKLKVKGLLKNIPDKLEIDVSSLKLGKTLIAKHVQIPGIQILDRPDTAIATVEIPRALRVQS
ncbi:MAG: 50S ribosomal protein L25 [Bacteroidia bacterium]